MSDQNNLQSLSELIGGLFTAEQARHGEPYNLVPVPNVWENVRQRLVTHGHEARLRNIFLAVSENGHYPTGFLPLHAALCLKLPVPHDIMIQLIEAFPDALNHVTELGFTPLHLAVNNDDLVMTRYIVSEYPKAVVTQSNIGLLPLHLTKSVEIAQLLLQVYPAGVRIADQWGNLPLHLATCHDQYSHEVVRLLLEKGSEYGIDGALALNVLSNHPLNIAIGTTMRNLATGEPSVELDQSWQKLKVCLWFVSKSRGYFSGSLLHICISTLHDTCLLEYAIRRRARDSFSTDANKLYPLHIAAMKPTIPGAIIRSLLIQYPPAASSFDLDSRLPLHHAALSGRKFDDGLRDLVIANSLSLTIQDTRSNLYPFIMAAVGEDRSVDSIYGLLRAEPNVLLSLFNRSV